MGNVQVGVYIKSLTNGHKDVDRLRFHHHIAHGVARGAVSVLQGGKFKHGFVSGFAGHELGGLGETFGFGKAGTGNFGDLVGRTMVTSIAAGTISQWTGGKFANGAISAAFVHLYNKEVTFFAKDGSGQITADHTDPRVDPAVRRYYDQLEGNAWQGNTDWGRGGTERWQWWDPQPGENDLLVAYVALPALAYAPELYFSGSNWLLANPYIATEVTLDFVGSSFPGAPAISWAGTAGAAAGTVYSISLYTSPQVAVK